MTITATAPAITTHATKRDWIALVVLMFPVLLVSVDNTVLSLALPELASALAPTATQQLWMIDAYPLVLAALLLIMGSLGDRIGRRRLLMVGVTGFAAVSGLAAFAPSAELLIAARIGLGFFGAMLMPSTLALLRTTFLDDAQRRLAIAVWAATFAAGSALGPLMGGLLLDATDWWGVVFLLAVPLLLPVLLLGGRVINESSSNTPGRLDVVSAILSALTMAPIVMAIKRVATHGPDMFALALLVIGLMIGYVFVRRQRVLGDPMLDVELFSCPAFSVSVLVNLLSMMAMAGFLFFASQHLQLVIALSPTRAALIMLPGAVAAIIAGLAVVRIVRAVGPRATVVVGVMITAVGFAITALAPVPLPAAILLIAFTCIGVGVGSAETISNDLVISSAPPAKAGSASAVSEMAYEVGALLGTAVLGGIVTAAYRAHLDLPAWVTPQARNAAEQTLAGALQVAQTLPHDQAVVVATAARTAFESGVSLTSGMSALIMVVAAAVALIGLRVRR